jgi:L-amino acid N-acyltransferase
MAEAMVATRAVTLRRARPGDNGQIAAIWNHAVRCTTATMDTELRSPAAQRRWLAEHDEDHPVVVAADGEEVLAYGSLSPYRDRPAFRATVADSVYVRVDARGVGLGARVVDELLRLARGRGHHSVMARITADNEASRRLHARLGFVVVGVERETAEKFGRRHDVVIMQRLLAR